MENRLTVLLLTALLLLVGCSNNTAIESSEQKSNISAQSSGESDASEENDFSEASDISDANDVSESSAPSVSTESSDPPEAGEPEASEPEISEPEVSEPETGTPEVSEPEAVSDDELVLITDYIPDIKTEIRYATENNFTGRIIYDSSDAYLRYGTVKKLMTVQAELKELGYELLIWDAYRPTEAQWRLWEVYPDASFVSDPSKGYSSHSRGNTVDITILRIDGENVEMPSEFDEFTAIADRDYSDVSEAAAENARLLEDIMYRNGFSGYRKEWWHYSDTVKYDVVK